MTVPRERLEQARAVMLELFPTGFEEVDGPGGTELVAYTTPDGEERVWHAFGGGRSSDVGEGWEDRWREFHRPVRVGPFWVGPPWEQAPADAVAVVVDPARAFGTGAHATTRLCLELLAEQPRGGVLDVGCGSGVLAIAAAKLGFAPVRAIDVDEHAVEAARRNAAANGVAVEISLGDALATPLPAAELALANIALEPLAGIAGGLRCGRLITSGYLEPGEPALDGFRRVERRTADGWAADLHVRE